MLHMSDSTRRKRTKHAPQFDAPTTISKSSRNSHTPIRSEASLLHLEDDHKTVPPITLQLLPIELLDRICAYLDRVDQACLAITSQRLARAILPLCSRLCSQPRFATVTIGLNRKEIHLYLRRLLKDLRCLYGLAFCDVCGKGRHAKCGPKSCENYWQFHSFMDFDEYALWLDLQGHVDRIIRAHLLPVQVCGLVCQMCNQYGYFIEGSNDIDENWLLNESDWFNLKRQVLKRNVRNV